MSFTLTITSASNVNWWPSLELDQANEVLSQIHYRPDPNLEPWKFELDYRNDYTTTGTINSIQQPGYWMKVWVPCWDSNTHKHTLIVHTLPVYSWQFGQGAAGLLRAALNAAVMIHTHEAMEMLRVGGERVVDPHANGQVLYSVP